MNLQEIIADPFIYIIILLASFIIKQLKGYIELYQKKDDLKSSRIKDYYQILNNRKHNDNFNNKLIKQSLNNKIFELESGITPRYNKLKLYQKFFKILLKDGYSKLEIRLIFKYLKPLTKKVEYKKIWNPDTVSFVIVYSILIMLMLTGIILAFMISSEKEIFWHIYLLFLLFIITLFVLIWRIGNLKMISKSKKRYNNKLLCIEK